MIPHTTPGIWPRIAPDRFAAAVSTDTSSGCQIGLLGLADDLGVRLNSGRVGARSGPTAFRAALARYGSQFDGQQGSPLSISVLDAGDIRPADGDSAESLKRTHDRVTEAVEAVCSAGLFPVCIGGGHDLTFPAVRAVSRHRGKTLGGINVDPHLDVRESVGSGMPYRALIEGGFVDGARFTEFGTGRFSNSQAHASWVRDAGATIIPIDRVLEAPKLFDDALFRATDTSAARPHPGLDAFVSIDLDCIDGSQAPGVSAPNPMGLPVQIASDIAFRAGAHECVRYFDIMELCPDHDLPHGPTARIAAHLFMMFIAGFSSRGRA